jgi:hypothetical protein
MTQLHHQLFFIYNSWKAQKPGVGCLDLNTSVLASQVAFVFALCCEFGHSGSGNSLRNILMRGEQGKPDSSSQVSH